MVEALTCVRRLGLFTIACTGASGGQLRDFLDVLIKVPSDDTPRIQEYHILAGHALCDAVEGAVVATGRVGTATPIFLMSVGRKKALFLDRDGVINLDRDHVHRREAFEFRPGIFELCRAAQELRYLLVVVTNQAGIARGYYSESDFLDLTRWMITQLKENEVHITLLYYCPYQPVFGLGKYKYDSPDRKPNPGDAPTRPGRFESGSVIKHSQRGYTLRHPGGIRCGGWHPDPLVSRRRRG